ncbi:MAG: 2-oxoglutarate oxidoreductase [Firmicutes bacterium]|nr:2-oxoglutarate oxidoreductase [Clostridiales bacterium]MBQ2747944.1 2-oxoglutarate oxidoreductase [Bacillota bacterium]MBQ3123587.1 2-oxoglutarate oxidoreductase [Bacillota bacterium]MBQ9972615.1 2-oxoglutarate oxidoreductase [Bacillota bacterium]
MPDIRLPKSVNFKAPSCQGCGHGIIIRLIGEVLEELGVAEKAIIAKDVACGSSAIGGLNIDQVTSAHGRPIPVANGIKGASPENIVIAHLGDGACYSIGSAELVHTALRGDNITVIVVNNTVYGMTGGQMSPASLPGEKTASTPYGKDGDKYGVLNVVDLIGDLNCTFLARGELYDVPAINNTKKLIKKAIQNQIDGKGLSFVEILAPCPTNLHMTPLQAKEFMHTEAQKYFPLGVFVDK